MGKLDGKVAFITGAGRGQGRSHAQALAAEGADIIAIDICADIETNSYALSSFDDLEETRRLVEKENRRCLVSIADVREPGQLRRAIADGVTELGRLDIVVANAGICPLGPVARKAFLDAVDVDLVGVINTVSAAMPHLGAGASIIATGSTAAMMKGGSDSPAMGAGGAGYTHAKKGVAQFVHDAAKALAPDSVRVNAVHPCNCNTDMLHSAGMYKIFRPDLDAPTLDDTIDAFATTQPMPASWVEPEDISKAVVFLASDDARFVTGMQMKVDAGQALAHTQAYALR